MKTAVEWYAARIHDIEFKKSVGAISVIEYYDELTKSLEQAKEMENQQRIDAYDDGKEDVFDWLKKMDYDFLVEEINKTE